MRLGVLQTKVMGACMDSMLGRETLQLGQVYHRSASDRGEDDPVIEAFQRRNRDWKATSVLPHGRPPGRQSDRHEHFGASQ
jgi:hypothetical protein